MQTMQTLNVENVVVDEANKITYLVMAPRILTDGELYSAIRIDVLRHGRRGANGEPVVITAKVT